MCYNIDMEILLNIGIFAIMIFVSVIGFSFLMTLIAVLIGILHAIWESATYTGEHPLD